MIPKISEKKSLSESFALVISLYNTSPTFTFSLENPVALNNKPTSFPADIFSTNFLLFSIPAIQIFHAEPSALSRYTSSPFAKLPFEIFPQATIRPPCICNTLLTVISKHLSVFFITIPLFIAYKLCCLILVKMHPDVYFSGCISELLIIKYLLLPLSQQNIC